MPSVCSATARPPAMRNHRRSWKSTFSSGSPSRDGTSTGRRPASRARSATRAERFDDRTALNVAAASTSVPPAVASEEMVDPVGHGRNLRAGGRASRGRSAGGDRVNSRWPPGIRGCEGAARLSPPMPEINVFRNARDAVALESGEVLFREGEPGDVDVRGGRRPGASSACTARSSRTSGRAAILGEMALIDAGAPQRHGRAPATPSAGGAGGPGSVQVPRARAPDVRVTGHDGDGRRRLRRAER